MKKKVWQYIAIAIGCFICSISINLFLVPHQLLSGGISGVAIILYLLFGLPIGIQTFVFNIPLIYAAYRQLGRTYTLTTIYGIIVFAVAVDATQFLKGYHPLSDPLLSAITGGFVSGIGSGLIFRVNGSAGGLDVVAAIIKKHYSFNVGVVGFSFNFIIMLVAAWLFGLQLAVLTLISMFIAANMTDKVIEGFNRRKVVYIISYNTEEISRSILQEVGRGATILRGEGAFTRQDKQVIFVVVSLMQIAKLKFLVQTADPQAFMIVSDAAEVLGRGFTLPGTKGI
ncbi:putative membrane protein [Propionispora sp. 2/2-37]|uniref:YitT family protein n=1 Tax=Propionispora sp. 2/2-37 TaxID=1677858 RepID=UPI0006BB8691|nr:YitT family protein [Propionispora sp. 2/2-37]CUH96529.1 putative membrane protein [Propionispora sp. 2/2-37]